jgi:cytoskeletal protein CcmA (bactofilin family)
MGLWSKKAAEPAAPQNRAAPAVEAKPTERIETNKETTSMAMLKREDEALPRSSGDVNAVLGRGTEFEGKLTFEGEVRLAGKFQGQIFSKDRLQIDDTARVTAEITAGSVVVYGEVNGNIKATQLVELKANAKVRGNIETPSLVIERGVMFEGACKMENLGKGGATVTPLKAADEGKKS